MDRNLSASLLIASTSSLFLKTRELAGVLGGVVVMVYTWLWCDGTVNAAAVVVVVVVVVLVVSVLPCKESMEAVEDWECRRDDGGDGVPETGAKWLQDTGGQ